MSNNAEYRSLVNQKANAQSQYNACSARIENCDYLLQRLRPAKEEIVELKESFKQNKQSDQNLYEEEHDWYGSTYRTFCSKMTDLIDENDSYYKNSIDYILDSLNDEITRIENLRMNEYGLFGRLGSLINSLANEIENFFN